MAAEIPSTPQDELAAKVKLLAEGVDFIENEGDVVAVESAVVKIQSTFRGKKFRSKLTQNKQQAETKPQSKVESKEKDNEKVAKKEQQQQAKDKEKEEEVEDKRLCERVSKMNVDSASKSDGEKLPTNQTPEEAEKAAAKIQAGFKGYRTRKELEGKLGANQSAKSEGKDAAD